MGPSQVGPDPDRPAICGNRLVELALAHQRVAEVGISLSEVGLDADRLAICGDRLVELALAHQRVAEPKMALGKLRLHCSHLPITRLGRDPLSSLVEPHSGRQQLSGWGLFAVHSRTLISNWPIAYCTRAMEKIIAHLPLLSRGLIDGVTALYRPWSVVGFLEMADAPEVSVHMRARSLLPTPHR